MHIPVELDRQLVERVGRDSPWLDHYRWILSSIIYTRFMDKRFTSDDWVPLNKKVLRSIISKRKECYFIRNLCAWGFIEQLRSWEVGKRSMGYRLKATFNHSPVKTMTLLDRGICSRLLHYTNRKKDVAIEAGPGYSETHRWLHQLRIDAKRAMRYIRARYPIHSDEYKSRLISIDLIASHNFFFTIDGKAGRAHHNLSNLAAELRQFVTLNGQPLVQVDLSNSQPMFLHFALSSSGHIEAAEVNQMRELLVSGKFYDDLKPVGHDREQYKKVIFRDVFYGPEMRVTTTTWRFRQKFPGHWKAIAKLKTPDHAMLAINMQATEARIIFSAVERFVARIDSSAPILTIHDSLVTTAEHVQTAQCALHEVFRASYGFDPPTRIK